MSQQKRDICDAPRGLSQTELDAVSGGLNPQPLPPGIRFDPVPLPWTVRAPAPGPSPLSW